ncbi:adenylyltransferase/sulfurtransferase [Pedobacter sp. AK017]|uniref:HesA/MoeB/ThiF family protein n=1 Tax=Pedobacter sp. AK017 TaxID=2723073 RepID=UPI0017FBA0B6|nr:HesA/MoeB/ThiF family protein [Pedobacter sp. AK017]MBB5437473.1 adenylyltransferase/sulfurtransferase [Pedobacter sp. AK017]
MENQKRYDRQVILPEIGLDGQQKLKNARVLVIGAGGLGCPLLLYLAAAGIGHMGIADHDVVDESNLQRQILYQMADIGGLKAEIAVNKLGLMNPDVDFRAYPFKLGMENAAELIAAYDLIIDGSDNFPTRYLVNDTCVALNKTLVFGSIFRFEGQVTVFNHKGGPDYRSLYPEPPAATEMPNCAEAGVIGTLPGITGTLMANEAIKIICGFGEVLSGKLLLFNALNNEMQVFGFGRHNVQNRRAVGQTGKMDVPALPGPQEISPGQLAEWKNENIAYQLIDVREAYEYEEYHIGGINIPLYELSQHIPALLQYEKIVFCCASGTRSKIALNLMKNNHKAECYTLIVSANQQT